MKLGLSLFFLQSNLILNLTMACNFVQIEPIALQTQTNCLTYIQKSEPIGKKLASSFRAEYAGVRVCCKDGHA